MGAGGLQGLHRRAAHRTSGKSLQGRAFLHDYDWKQDKDFGVLELIMTAPVVVASWISLQYYGSTVAPDAFGAGNKLLHNVTGGIGVVEGNGGARCARACPGSRSMTARATPMIRCACRSASRPRGRR
jgi:uncharacterized protein YbcC (UPF0753/DUF2309 family)